MGGIRDETFRFVRSVYRMNFVVSPVGEPVSGEWALVERARQGDISAFEAILEPLIAPAHRLAAALLQDPALAEDAVQEAAVRAWTKLGQVKEGKPVLPWFLGVVANQCRDEIRGRWWRLVRVPNPRHSVVRAPEDSIVSQESVRGALRRLPDGEREVLVMRMYLDLSWAQVASALRLTEAGARTRYYRALDRLRPLFAPQDREI